MAGTTLLGKPLVLFGPPHWPAAWARWREKWLSRFLARRGPLTPPFTLLYRRIFILPTRFGLAYGVLLAAMILGGLNFNNNLGLLLGFLLVAAGHASLHLTYLNLRGIAVRDIVAPPVYAGQPIIVHLRLAGGDGRLHHAIEAHLAQASAVCDLRPAGNRSAAETALSITLPALPRGLHDPGRVKLASRYPLGLFRAWSWIEGGRFVMVYPRPAPHPPPLPIGPRGTRPTLRPGSGEDDMLGLREYRAGDPLPAVAWKASARHQNLLSKLFAAPQGGAVDLDWHQATAPDDEQRLEILCAWVLEAHRRQLRYRLILPGSTIPAATGDAHCSRCLAALALF